MSIAVELYRNFSDNRYVNKNIEKLADVTATWYEDNSNVVPTIKFTYNNPNVLNDCNYVKIPYFGRYYYVTDVRSLVGCGMEMDLRCDVLMTYKDAIINSNMMVIRNEAPYGKPTPTLISDPTLPLAPYKDLDVIEFQGGNFNLEEATNTSFNFILNVAGGAQNST